MDNDKYRVIEVSNGASLEKELNEAQGWKLHSFSTSIYPNHQRSTQKVIIIAVLEKHSTSGRIFPAGT